MKKRNDDIYDPEIRNAVTWAAAKAVGPVDGTFADVVASRQGAIEQILANPKKLKTTIEDYKVAAKSGRMGKVEDSRLL